MFVKIRADGDRERGEIEREREGERVGGILGNHSSVRRRQPLGEVVHHLCVIFYCDS